MLKPSARCPKCGRAPALRIPEGEKARAGAVPPSRVVADYRCRCGQVYPLLASAWHAAS